MINTRKKIEICNKLIKLRLEEMPNNNLYHFAQKQMELIDSKLQKDGKLNEDDYRGVRIGLMCAKELENIDDEFCNAVYTMTTSIMPKNYEF